MTLGFLVEYQVFAGPAACIGYRAVVAGCWVFLPSGASRRQAEGALGASRAQRGRNRARQLRDDSISRPATFDLGGARFTGSKSRGPASSGLFPDGSGRGNGQFGGRMDSGAVTKQAPEPLCQEQTRAGRRGCSASAKMLEPVGERSPAGTNRCHGLDRDPRPSEHAAFAGRFRAILCRK